MKRTDYLSWDAYFMGVALLSAQRSKANHTQAGVSSTQKTKWFRLAIMACRQAAMMT